MRTSAVIFPLILAAALVLGQETADFRDEDCFNRCNDPSSSSMDPCVISVLRSDNFVGDGGNARRVTVTSSGMVGVSAGLAGFRLPNVSDPLNPFLTGFFSSSGAATTARFFRDNTLVSVVDSSSLFIVNLTDSTVVGGLNSLNSIGNITIENGFSIIISRNNNAAYIADGQNGLRVINITELSSPQQVTAIVQNVSNAADVAAPSFSLTPEEDFNWVVVCSMGPGTSSPLAFFNTSNELELQSLGFILSEIGACVDVDVSRDGRWIGMASASQFVLINVEDPSAPGLRFTETPNLPVATEIVDIDFGPPAQNGAASRLHILAGQFLYLYDFDGLSVEFVDRINLGELHEGIDLQIAGIENDFVPQDVEYSPNNAYFYGSVGAAGFYIFCTGNLLSREATESNNNAVIIGATVGTVLGVCFCCFLFLGIGFGALTFWRRRSHRERLFNQSEMRVITHLTDVTKGDLIGAGHGGNVYKGVWKRGPVALKSLRGTNEDEFTNEARLLCQLDFPHVLHFYGTTELENELFIVTEYMNLGDLRSYLQNQVNISTPSFIELCSQVCLGLNFLHGKNIIHRDLAARNILLSGEENHLTAKVADFGLSREINLEYYTSSSKSVPIRWTSPEAIEFHKFTKQSDVWALAIVFWEIFSRGAIPYAGIENDKVFEQVKRGLRLIPPSQTPEWMSKMMQDCWDEQVAKRPSTETLCDVFGKHTELEAQKQEAKNYAQIPADYTATGTSIYFTEESKKD